MDPARTPASRSLDVRTQLRAVTDARALRERARASGQPADWDAFYKFLIDHELGTGDPFPEDSPPE